MHVGVMFTGFDMAWPDLRQLWINADVLGFDSAWVNDNVVGPVPLDPKTPVFESFTTLAAVAEITNKIRLGTLVSPVGRRHPAMLAKMAAGIDHISGGRFILGVGADDEIRHFRPWGMDYPPADERIDRVGEAIEVVTRLWSATESNWGGTHYHLDGAVLEPKPLSKPMPPIWVGVVRPENLALLEIAGRYADGVNVFDAQHSDIPIIRDRVERAAVAAGRDPSPLQWSRLVGVSIMDDILDDDALDAMARRAGRFETDVRRHFVRFEHHIAGPPDYCVQQLLAERELGFETIIVHFSLDPIGLLRSPIGQLEMLDLFGQAILPILQESTQPPGVGGGQRSFCL